MLLCPLLGSSASVSVPCLRVLERQGVGAASHSPKVPCKGALFLSVLRAMEGHLHSASPPGPQVPLTGDPESLAVFALWVGRLVRNTRRPAEADPLWKVGRYLEYSAAPWPPYDHRTPRKPPQRAGKQCAPSLCGARCCVLPPWAPEAPQALSWRAVPARQQSDFLYSWWGHRTRKSGWRRRPATDSCPRAG